MIVPGDFKKEKRNLIMLNSSISNHDYIVRYLAIIILGDKASAKDFSILMPLANMNLRTFLYQDPPLCTFRIEDLLRQAANIADAIRWLHSGLPIWGKIRLCCHMDLKLDNVLVYLDEADKEEPIGKWKICDFGISKLEEPEELEERRAEHRSRPETLTVESPAQTLARLTARMPAARVSGPYQAPEVAKGNEIGRSSDVWSFGCILFQVLARGVGAGNSKLLELDKLRCLEEDKQTLHPTDYFFRERGQEKYLNPHVKNWLKEGLSGDTWFNIYLVKSCKKLISEMLKIEAKHRLPAEKVNQKLWNILKGPEEAPFAEFESRSTTPRRPSLSVPGISITPAQNHGNPRVIQQPTFNSEFSPSATLNGPFDTWNVVPLGSVTAPTTGAHNVLPLPISSRGNSCAGSPSIHNYNTAPRLQTEQAPNLNIQSSPPSRNTAFASPNPNGTCVVGGLSGHITSNNPQNQPQASYQTCSHAQAQISNQESPETQIASGRGSTSQSTNRSDSLASMESRVSIEAIPYSTAPFSGVKDVVQALISPTTGNVVFITKKAISIRTTSGPASYFTIGAENFEWESGSMAGDYLTAIGRNKSTQEQVSEL